MEERESHSLYKKSALETGIVHSWKQYPVDPQNSNNPKAQQCRVISTYKGKVVVYSGDQWEQKDKNQWNSFLHIFCPERKRWMKSNLKADSPDIKHVRFFKAKYGTIVGSRFFLFGQQKPHFSQTMNSWKLNMQTLEWTEIDQKGDIPVLTEGGTLIHYQKNWLIFFGGHCKGELNNLLYLYNVDSKNWYICQGNYKYNIRGRYNTAIVPLGDKVYIYGGYTQGQEGVEVLNDFWELKILLPLKGNIPRANATRIHSSISPEPRGDHILAMVKNKDICLLGGRNSQGFQSSMWNFNLSHQEWEQVGKVEDQYVNKQGYLYTQQLEDIWIFGGSSLQNNNQKSSQNESKLLNLHLQLSQKKISDNKTRSGLSQKYSQSCTLCYENRFDFMIDSEPFSSNFIDQIKESLEFPFSAFALLTDNALSLNAQKVVISVEGDRGHQWFRVEDNGKMNFSQEELVGAMCSYSYQNSIILSGCDKKAKKQISRQNSIRQYGANLKVGGLRLGKRLLFVSHNNNKVYVFLISKKDSEQTHYEIQYYSMDSTKYEVTKKQMIGNRTSIDSKYNRYIKPLLQDRQMKNTLFIFDSIINDRQQLLSINVQTNDIIYGEPQHIQYLQNLGYKMEECIDVSFKAYLSFLYLRNETCLISFVIGRSVSHVSLQGVMEKVDKMCKVGEAIELDSVVEFDFKLDQLFYLRELRQNTIFFSNGVLLYEHNRLVSRVRPKLGTLLTHMRTQITSYSNYLPLFGFVQLPQTIPLNIFKNNFTFDLMLDRMLARFKLVEKSFNKNIKTVIVTKTHSEAHSRRQRLNTQNMLPTKQLSRRSRSHYGQRNWDQLPNKYESEIVMKKNVNKKAYKNEKIEQHGEDCVEDPADAEEWVPNRQFKNAMSRSQ